MVSYPEPSGWNSTRLDNCVLMVAKKETGIKPFILERRTCKLTFPEDHEYHGMVIRARLDVDVKTFLDLQTLSSSEVAEETKEAFLRFGQDIVLEWNVHDENGQPINADGDGFISLPPTVCGAIIDSWAQMAGTVGEV